MIIFSSKSSTVPASSITIGSLIEAIFLLPVLFVCVYAGFIFEVFCSLIDCHPLELNTHFYAMANLS